MCQPRRSAVRARRSAALAASLSAASSEAGSARRKLPTPGLPPELQTGNVEEGQYVRHLAPAALRSHGEVHVVSRVVGFKKIKFYTNENIGAGESE